jgi:hypothetical protein
MILISSIAEKRRGALRVLGAAWEEGAEVWAEETAETTATLPVALVFALFGPLAEVLVVLRPAVAAERFGAILNGREKLRRGFWWCKIKTDLTGDKVSNGEKILSQEPGER